MQKETYNVMIVEDDALLLLVEEKLVDRLGYNVVATAPDSDSAIKMIKEKNPDVILMDINIHGSKNGFEVMEELHKEGVYIPVIFLSGEMKGTHEAWAKQIGCIDYLTKPVSTGQLKISLKKATDHLKLTAEPAA